MNLNVIYLQIDKIIFVLYRGNNVIFEFHIIYWFTKCRDNLKINSLPISVLKSVNLEKSIVLKNLLIRSSLQQSCFSNNLYK